MSSNSLSGKECERTKVCKPKKKITYKSNDPNRFKKASDKLLEKHERNKAYSKCLDTAPANECQKRENRVPFNMSSCRFKDETDRYPGPGTYSIKRCLCKRVRYKQSFGGTPTDLPPITLKSPIPQNTVKLMSTTDENRYNRRLAYFKLFF